MVDACPAAIVTALPRRSGGIIGSGAHGHFAQAFAAAAEYTSGMQNSRFASLLPVLAVLGSVTSLSIGTSYAKNLFPLIGAQGTSALRVGFSALFLLLLWRPWGWRTSRAVGAAILR